MKKALLLISLVILSVSSLSAQNHRKNNLSSDNRDKWLLEVRNAKHEFLVKELQLTRDQQNAFFPVYDKMDDELNRINIEVRDLEKKVTGNAKASDTEIESAARATFEQKQREANVEMQYYDKFRKILKPKQLLKLKEAERKFTRELVKKRNKR